MRIYSDHPESVASIDLQVAAPHALEKLLSAARQTVDAVMLSGGGLSSANDRV